MTRAEITAERNGARQLYLLTLLLPLIALPLVCLGPVAFLLPLLYLYLLFSGLFSRRAFVQWHARQWLLWSLACGALGVCGFFMAVISSGRGEASLVASLSGLVIGGGWWLGNLVGMWQAYRGDCLLWSLWAPSAPLPRPWKEAQATGPDYEDILSRGQKLSIYSHRHAEAVECFMQVFRAGPPTLRRRAIIELDKLGEVEVF
jgi:hypothetical protein